VVELHQDVDVTDQVHTNFVIGHQIALGPSLLDLEAARLTTEDTTAIQKMIPSRPIPRC
jgi:hypothetical protein